jgi:hypothetical protein
MRPGAAERGLEVLEIVWLKGDLVCVEAAEPLPIGTRVCADLARVAAGAAIPDAPKGKVIDVKRAGAGFSVTLRLHSMTREQRAGLAAIASRG